MKFLIAFASLALFAIVNADPYGSSRGGYGGGYGSQIAYVQEPSYGRSSYGGGYGGDSYSQPLYSRPSGARAVATASANNGAIRSGKFDNVAVLGLEVDGSYNAPSYGGGYGGRRGGYGRGGY